jgi:hypothetical protein
MSALRFLLLGIGRRGTPSGGGLWTPADAATTPGLWFDAQDSATVTHSSGEVSAIGNKGTNGGLGGASQGTSGNRPSYSATGFDGVRGGITHDGWSSRYLSLPSLASTGWTAAEVFYVSKRNDDPPGNAANTSPVFCTLTCGSGEHEPYTDGNIYMGTFSTTRQTVGNPTPSLTSPRIINIRSSSSNWLYVVDTATIHTAGSNTFALPSAPLIAQAQGGLFYDGVWGEIIVFPAILSSGDRAKVEGYLAWRWNLQTAPNTGVLGSGHTYSSAAPTV